MFNTIASAVSNVVAGIMSDLFASRHPPTNDGSARLARVQDGVQVVSTFRVPGVL